MKFTLSWLKQHLETNSDTETILKKLTNIGLEVEDSYNPSEALNGFIAAKILSIKPHPDADRLQLCLIDTGAEKNRSCLRCKKCERRLNYNLCTYWKYNTRVRYET